jgi:hypothetical protein
LDDWNHTSDCQNHTLNGWNHGSDGQNHTLDDWNHTFENQNHILAWWNHMLACQITHGMTKITHWVAEITVSESNQRCQIWNHPFNHQIRNLEFQITISNCEIIIFVSKNLDMQDWNHTW